MNSYQSYALQTHTTEIQLPSFNGVSTVPLEFARFQGELSRATWVISAPTPPISVAEEEDFSRTTYLFFHIGWVFLVLGVGLMIVGPFLIPHPWTGFTVGIVLLVSGVGFWQCLLHADDDKTQARQENRQFST